MSNFSNLLLLQIDYKVSTVTVPPFIKSKKRSDTLEKHNQAAIVHDLVASCLSFITQSNFHFCDIV